MQLGLTLTVVTALSKVYLVDDFVAEADFERKSVALANFVIVVLKSNFSADYLWEAARR